MDNPTIQVLLVEDNPTDALLVREELEDSGGGAFAITHVEQLRPALAQLATGRFDVALLDLGLPDSDGLATFEQLHHACPGVPVIILSGRDDEQLAVVAVHAGAQDYLVKAQGESSGLARAIRYAIERWRDREMIAAQARQQSIVAALGQRALAGANLNALFDETVVQVHHTLGAEICQVFEMLAGGARFHLRAGVGGLDGATGQIRIDAETFSQLAFTVRSTAPVVVEDLAAENRFIASSFQRALGVVSGVTVLIPGRHQPWGVLGAQTARRRAFTPHEITFLQTVASVLGEAIERKVTEAALHESDARFHQVVENIPEALWMFEPETKRVVYVSPRYAEIWGRPDSSLTDSADAWLENIHPDDWLRIKDTIGQLRGTGESETYRIIRPDGSIRWIRHRTFAARDAAGNVRRLIVVAEDTTEQKKLEEQFLRSQRMEAIGTLAGGVAHDLNNILAPVLMTAELLTARAADGRDRELLAMMNKGAQRAADTVKQLLLFSRGAEGQRGLVQPRHLLKEMAGIMRETFPREITIVEEPGPELWPVIADATQLHQVLMNLCVNARDAMSNGGTLTLGAANVQLQPEDLLLHPDARLCRYLILSVTDTGHGIAPEIINRIFDPFFTTKGLGRGSGLGLSTVAGIMRSHGGFLIVQSEPGRGSTFKGYLPAAGESAFSALAQTPPPAPLGRGELVLVVDDEQAIREAMREILELHQYRVLSAADGREALDVYVTERDQIRLVITDLMMPVMNGFALVRALRGLDPDLKVIATSGLDQDEKRTELAALGIADVLMKPFRSAQLLEIVRRQLGRGRSAVPWNKR